MGWDYWKDLGEFAVTVGTVLSVGIRMLVKAKLRDQKIATQLEAMQTEIATLREEKMDREVQEAENGRLHEALREVRLDLKESSQMMSRSIEKMAESVNKLEGTVHTFFDLFANKKI